jgi:hypothetical protein
MRAAAKRRPSPLEADVVAPDEAAAEQGGSGGNSLPAAAPQRGSGAPRGGVDPAALESIGGALRSVVRAVLASEEVAAALAGPGEPPLLEYRGGGVIGPAGAAGDGKEAEADDPWHWQGGAATAPRSGAGAPGGGGGGGASDEAAAAAGVAFAEMVLDSALVGALQDAVEEGALEGGAPEGGAAGEGALTAEEAASGGASASGGAGRRGSGRRV